jgi:hypothetical protein
VSPFGGMEEYSLINLIKFLKFFLPFDVVMNFTSALHVQGCYLYIDDQKSLLWLLGFLNSHFLPGLFPLYFFEID